MEEQYKILKLTSEELDTIKYALMQIIVDIKVEQTKIEEERKLKPEEEIKFRTNFNKYQNVLKIISYVERD